MNRILNFIKKEAVLCVAVLLAVISMIIVPPTKEYLEYRDYRVLAILWCLMLVVAGLKEAGLFDRIIEKLTERIKSVRLLRVILVLICFVSSMIITNDVALITFVPFAIALLMEINREKDIVYIVVLQTIAANLGSMVTPIGNPQNVFLYSTYNIGIGRFMVLMLPLAVVSLVMLTVLTILPKESGVIMTAQKSSANGIKGIRKIIPVIIFAVSILCVVRIIDYRIMLLITVIGVALWNYRIYAKADYMLLITFVAFFVFVGNMKNIPQVSQFLGKIIDGNEILVSVGASQIISNVPAAVLLSGFTDNGEALLLGTNIGGLGTLIASMASLISFKAYGKVKECKKGRYLLVFTGLNVLFLAVMLLMTFLLY